MTAARLGRGASRSGFHLLDNQGSRLNLSLDAFGRLRVSEPFTIFDSKQIYTNPTTPTEPTLDPLLFAKAVTGTGSITYSKQRASSTLAVAAAGDTAIRQSRRYWNYQPGKSFLVKLTFALGAIEPTATKRIGYFDAANGLFLSIGGSASFALRSSVSGVPIDTVVPQADWNMDTLDGNGPSGNSLDLTKAQILFIAFEWLGVGTAVMGFVQDGEIIPCHVFNVANSLTGVYMSTPNLPVRWSITAAADGAASFEAVCCSVESEGGQQIVGVQRSVTAPFGGTSLGTTLSQLLSIRLNPANPRATVTPSRVSIITTTNANARFALVYRPTIGGVASWNNVPASNLQYDVARNAQAVTGGYELASAYFSNSTEFGTIELEQLVSLGADIAGVSDEIALAVQTTTGTDTFFATLTYIEPS